MSWDATLAELGTAVAPALGGLVLAGARVVPVAFFCPLLGGQLAPSSVRLAVAGAVAWLVRPAVRPGAGSLATAIVHELGLGIALGLAAALPFDAARIGGRLVDLVRGTSAEAALPVAGHRESATADLLHQLVLCLALSAGALPAVVHALARSYALVPAGATSLDGETGVRLAHALAVAVGTGLAVAAPVVALSWATDAALGLLSRSAPGVPAHELAAPVRILGGATLLWLALGTASDRLLEGALGAGGSGVLRTVLVAPAERRP